MKSSIYCVCVYSLMYYFSLVLADCSLDMRWKGSGAMECSGLARVWKESSGRLGV